MILDQELAQLSKPKTAVIGAFGFTALGAALGLTPSAFALWDKAPKDLTHSDVIAGLVAAGSISMAIVCLGLFAISSWRNRGLAGTIRARKKSGLGASSKGSAPDA